MNTENEHDLLVELQGGTGGLSKVGIADDLVAKSRQALEAAMGAVKEMAVRLSDSMDTLEQKPTQVEMEFSLRLDANTNVWVAKTGAEGAIKVKLVWKPKE